MKTFYVTLLLIVVSISGIAQDTLFTKEGKTISGKVIEVRSQQVKYKSATDTDKQFSWIATSNLSSIHYHNGVYDVFESLTDSSSFRTTVIDGKSIPNQPTNPNFDNQAKENAYAQKVARQQAVADGVMVGLRVVGFILRVAFEVALATSGDCHSHSSNHHSSNHNSGSNHPRGH
ncbi:MAG: hypothetical protein H0W73_08735 [Bacteroidetes bacterium]|nr:hypothetical protein [Bacteroidota bacterium]